MVWLLNLHKTPGVVEDTHRKVQELIESGDVELDEVTTDFVEGFLLLDAIVRTTLVSAVCMILWSFIE